MNKAIILPFVLMYISFAGISCSPKNDASPDYIAMGYYDIVYEADSLFLEGHYDKAYALLHPLFKKVRPQNMDVYYEYKTYVQSAYATGNIEDAREGLERLISEYGTTWGQITSDSLLSRAAKEAKINQDRFNELHTIHQNRIDYDLRNELIEMRRLDQMYRKGKLYEQNKHKQDSIDALHEQRLIEIFETVGYPNACVVGKSGIPPNNANINTILLHTSDSIRLNYFLPKVLTFVKNGTCDPMRYGTMFDQYRLYHKQDQKYGTYQSKRGVQSQDSLNLYRKSIGLPRHGYEAWRRQKKYGDMFN